MDGIHFKNIIQTLQEQDQLQSLEISNMFLNMCLKYLGKLLTTTKTLEQLTISLSILAARTKSGVRPANIKLDALSKFLSSLSRNKSLTQLTVRSIVRTESDITSLIRSLAGNTSINYLSISGPTYMKGESAIELLKQNRITTLYGFIAPSPVEEEEIEKLLEFNRAMSGMLWPLNHAKLSIYLRDLAVTIVSCIRNSDTNPRELEPFIINMWFYFIYSSEDLSYTSLFEDEDHNSKRLFL
eukprot:TRINITY_DN302_c0_g1_i1.p1 TRINITY_DN302_c0_g1~~TRINITY_DN302_c0_g1_i1.p1  ORF type:complete len:241 (+),score=35.66 TRINITY_DN302_c0_g1_i1:327-1049(+)